MKPNTDDTLSALPRSRRVQVYDTTLRDGTQREGISLSCSDKLRITERLDGLGIAYVEGGWPGSNPKDAEFFAQVRDLELRTTKVAAFGSTRRPHVACEDDPQLAALIAARTAICTIFGKSSVLHVTEVLRTETDENLRMIEESCAFLRSNKVRVFYDAEHFFDGYREDAAYALETLRAAIRGGAEVVVLCDTNGGSFPSWLGDVVREVQTTLAHPVGIHPHNDGECAVANALAAVAGGARHVQGTINGYGERCGNANLCAIIPNLELKLGHRCLPDGGLAQLYDVSHFVAEVSNLQADEHMAYVGRSAFAHKGGVHVSAIRRTKKSYEHVEPALVGNATRVVVSELSGRGNLLEKAEELAIEAADGVASKVLAKIKEAEARGFSYEAAEASVALLFRRESDGYVPPFRVLEYQVVAGLRQGTGPYAEATVKVAVGEQVLHVVADGNGPVSALDAALRKGLAPVYPYIERIKLENYKVRILDADSGTDAITRVLVESHDGVRAWSTVGAGTNIIEASLQALVDGMEYRLDNLTEAETRAHRGAAEAA